MCIDLEKKCSAAFVPPVTFVLELANSQLICSSLVICISLILLLYTYRLYAYLLIGATRVKHTLPFNRALNRHVVGVWRLAARQLQCFTGQGRSAHRQVSQSLHLTHFSDLQREQPRRRVRQLSGLTKTQTFRRGRRAGASDVAAAAQSSHLVLCDLLSLVIAAWTWTHPSL